ncbi:protein FAM161A isoform X2 [Erinaceus europaeus]|uniref:Protein FAM161A n=1 Tax=Erinaceus europaeus TaxID=9365 RepID=A0A1S3ARX4_ERIEU|nr:protein FAM161A isoform X2 [Erinaceus europaeus]
MAASDQAAELATSSLHLLENPNTEVQDAQYKHEDPETVLSAAVEDLEKEEKEEGKEKTELSARAPDDFNTSFSEAAETSISHENFLDFSAIYQSNEEYFRKLEKLKAAHMETMAKLEKMCQNKLNFNPSQPVFIREETPSDSCWSLSEKNDDPVSLMPSFLEPDLGLSFSLITSSSEDELSNLEKEYPKKNRLVNFAKELINSMWVNFSVEDYIQRDDTDFPEVRKTKKKPSEWIPKITVPEPFQMTVREQKKKEENMKSKSDVEMENKELKNQEEDLECKKKFRANPVPAFVFTPLYDNIVKESEEQRKFRKEKNKEALLASLKPFKFIAREEQKKAIRAKQLRDLFKSKKKTKSFKAKPIPLSTYESPNDKLKEEEFCKNMKTQLKIQEFLKNSSPQSGSPTRKSFNTRKSKYPEQVEKLKNKYKAKYQTADFEDLPEQKHLPDQKYSKFLTESKPFALDTVTHASTKRGKTLLDIDADEEKVKETNETHESNRSPRHKSPVRSTSYSNNPPMPTVSSRGREQATRRSLEEKKMLEEERNRILTKQKQRMKELQKLLINRAMAYDTHQSLAQMSKSRVKSLRKREKERMKEYWQELQEREEKLKHRPLLFERVSQKNARMAAEKHYSNTLKALGISDEFVSKKGQNGKIFESFNNQEMKSFTEDKESSNEEEIIEGENEEENYFIDSNSQESCKEKDEADEESGEGESVC